MALQNSEHQRPSSMALARLAPLGQERPLVPEDDILFTDTFRRVIYAFGHEKFAEFAASISAFGFPAKVEFSADPAAGIDVLILRLVPQEGAQWSNVSIMDECSFSLRALHGAHVIEHVACIDPAAAARGERTTVCCLHSLTPAVLDRELTSFLREVLEVRARQT